MIFCWITYNNSIVCQLLKKIRFIFLFSTQLISASILYDTIIKTPDGFVAAENVKIGTALLGRVDGASLAICYITDISADFTDAIVILTTYKGNICAVPDQLFFNPITNRWIRAKDITIGTKLLDAQANHCECITVKTVMVPATNIYRVSTTFPHTFFVSEQQLLTHNFFPIALGFSLFFGGGIEFAGLTIGTSILGTIFGIKLLKERGAFDNKTPTITAEWSNTYSGYNPDPNDDDDNDKGRKYNTISKSEFFKKEGRDYKYKQDGIYKREKGSKGLDKKVEYIKWDHLHGDIEAYDKAGVHLGSYCPKTLRLYKSANPRNFIQI